jgi:hypothetical protein
MAKEKKGIQPNWQTIGASVVGVSHVKSAMPCQDAHAFGELPGGLLIVAVSDGAGSAALAEVGAQTAVNAAMEYLRKYLPTFDPFNEAEEAQAFLMRVLQAARNAVEDEAFVRNVTPRDLAATLIVLAMNDRAAIAAQVGDGAAVLQNSEGQLVAFTAPQQGEYVNETTFLISPDYLNTAQFRHTRGRFSHAALFSDGLQRLALKLPEGEPHAPFFAPLFGFIAQASEVVAEQRNEQLAAFLQSPRITERADDDLTLVLAARNV